MINGDIVTTKLKSVRFHKKERMAAGALYGVYSSCYVARLDLLGEVIVVIDSIAAKMHPDWEKKNDSRAATLEQELRGKKVKCKVVEIIDPRHIECELIEIL